MRIAITGGIAEGKSTVMEMIRGLGHATASSDAMAREVFHDPAVQALLAELVGTDAGIVTPPELREAMAASDEVRKAVNRIMHPRIRSLMMSSEASFHEVPLLIEACLYGRYDGVWVVTCGPDEQLRRLSTRLGDEAKAAALIGLQLSSEVKVAFADRVIDSAQSLPQVEAAVRRLIGEVAAAGD